MNAMPVAQDEPADTPGVPFALRARPMVARLLEEARSSYQRPNHVEAVLWSAHALDPACLAVYYGLYKFYFRRSRLEDAERVVSTGLVEAARQSGLSSDWRTLAHDASRWGEPDAPQHFYLFSLKALAFIRLRRGATADAGQILDKLAEIDPGDCIGTSVVRALYLRAIGP